MSDDTKDKGGKLISLSGAGEPDVFADTLRNMRRNMTNILEYKRIDAQIKRAAYLALIKEGFTPEQALELTKGA